MKSIPPNLMAKSSSNWLVRVVTASQIEVWIYYERIDNVYKSYVQLLVKI